MHGKTFMVCMFFAFNLTCLMSVYYYAPMNDNNNLRLIT